MSATDTDRSAGVGIRLSLEAVLGQISQTMSGLNDTVQKLHKFMTPNPRQSPIVRPLVGSITAKSTADTYTLIDLGGPAAGRIWDLRRVAVARTVVGTTGAAADFSTQAASMIVNVIAATQSGSYNQVGAANILGPSDVFDAAAAANNPYVKLWSAHEASLRYPLHVMVAVKGMANSDNWSAWGQAEEYIESSYEVVVA